MSITPVTSKELGGRNLLFPKMLIGDNYIFFNQEKIFKKDKIKYDIEKYKYICMKFFNWRKLYSFQTKFDSSSPGRGYSAVFSVDGSAALKKQISDKFQMSFFETHFSFLFVASLGEGVDVSGASSTFTGSPFSFSFGIFTPFSAPDGSAAPGALPGALPAAGL